MDFIKSGCCNSQGGPDFSKLDLQKLSGLCWVFHVNLCEKSLWFSIANIGGLPLLVALVDSLKWSPFPDILSATTFVEITAFIFSLLRVLKFHQMMMLQPEWEVLQSSTLLLLGYQLLALGLLFYILSVGAYGLWNTFFRLDFSIPSLVKASLDQKGRKVKFRRCGWQARKQSQDSTEVQKLQESQESRQSSLQDVRQQSEEFQEVKKPRPGGRHVRKSRQVGKQLKLQSQDSMEVQQQQEKAEDVEQHQGNRKADEPQVDRPVEQSQEGQQMKPQEEETEVKKPYQLNKEFKKHHRVVNLVPKRFGDLCRGLRAASFCCYMGYSIICASQAGILVTLLQSLSLYYRGSHF